MSKFLNFIFAVYLITPCLNINAQISQGGLPPSFKISTKSTLNNIEYMKMSLVDVESLRAEDVYNDQIKDQPWRFGKVIFVDYNTENSGVWDVLMDGSRIWRLGVTSKGAQSINLTFNKYRLPNGAQLFIYNSDKSVIIGAFTEFNNQDDGYFATTLIMGESVIIEYFEPKKVEFPGELNLESITHGYRGPNDFQKSFGGSGYCNINATCPQGDSHREQIRSVALLILNGGFCTGALINNTNNDGTPLFLTANHCYDNAGTAVFWFNWQSENCDNPGSSPLYNSMSGATNRARYSQSDFWLIKLNQEPPEDYKVYYSGWNRTTALSISGTVFGVHHPSADIKKISWTTSGVDAAAGGEDPGSGTDHWRVASWSDGTTESGSSGSPLYDSAGRIIGQLHGGDASCDSIAPDWYGSLGYSWTGGGSISTRLSSWLDPIGTGVITLDGYDPVFGQNAIDGGIVEICEPEHSYTDTVMIIPEIIIRNFGTNNLTEAEVSYILDNESAVNVSWTGDLLEGESDTVIFPAFKPGFSEYQIVANISVTGDENPANDSLLKYFKIINCDSVHLPIEEGFNYEEIPGCWNIKEVSGTNTEITFVTSGTDPKCSPGEGSHMVKFNSYYCLPGSEIRLSTPLFSTISFIDLFLSFDWFYDSNMTSRDDKVIIQYSLDCLNWHSIDSVRRTNEIDKGWIGKNISFTDEMKDQDSIYIGFLFHSGYGNNCYFDNLEIGGIDTTQPYIDFYASSLVNFIDSIVTFSDSSKYGIFSSWEWNFGENAFPATASDKGPHQVVYTSSGKKSISLIVDGAYSKTKEDYITIKSSFASPQFLTALIIDSKDVLLGWDLDTLFEDGFESGNFSKWHELVEGSGSAGISGRKAYWYAQSNSVQYVYEGDYGALVDWGYNIDTWIISPPVVITNRTIISFVWQSNYYLHVDPYANGDLFVKISLDGGQNWEDPIWTFGEIGEWETWVWYKTTIDLSEFNTDTVNIAFNILANDNADIALDNVYIGDAFEKNKIFGTYPMSKSFESDPENKTLSYTPEIIKFSDKSIEATFLNYTVYRDNNEIAETTANTYLDIGVPLGLHSYYVTATYNSPTGISDPSNVVGVNMIKSGVQDVDNSININLFPNPSSGIINVNFDDEYKLTILNLQATVLDKLNVNTHTVIIDLSGYPVGIYILRFEDRDSIFTKKVIIK